MSNKLQSHTQINKSHMIWFALSITLLGVSSTDIYISSLPKMVSYFNTNPDMINLTISCYTFAMAIGGLFIGILSNRFGRRPTLLTGMVLYIVTSSLIAYTNSIVIMIILRIIQGIACSTIAVMTRIIFKDIMDIEEQVHANGMLVMGIVISPAIAPSIGAYLAEHFDWQSCFKLSAFIGAILLAFAFRIVKETNSTPIAKLERPTVYLTEYINILRDKYCQNLLIIASFSFAAYYVFIGISSYLYINKLQISPINYSYIFIIIAIGYFAGNSLMMFLNKNHITPNRIIKIGLSISLVGLMFIIIACVINNITAIAWLLTIGVLIMRGGSALIISPVQVKLVEHVPTKSAFAVGLAQFIQFALSSLAVSTVVLFHNIPLFGMLLMTIITFTPVIVIGYR